MLGAGGGAPVRAGVPAGGGGELRGGGHGVPLQQLLQEDPRQAARDERQGGGQQRVLTRAEVTTTVPNI